MNGRHTPQPTLFAGVVSWYQRTVTMTPITLFISVSYSRQQIVHDFCFQIASGRLLHIHNERQFYRINCDGNASARTKQMQTFLRTRELSGHSSSVIR